MRASKIITMIIVITLVVSSVAFATEGTDYGYELVKLGIIQGTDKGLEPEKSFTREQAATIIVRLLGREDSLSKVSFEQIFDDISPKHWSYRYVMYCYNNGITKGTGADTFSPSQTIDASQFITLMLRLMGYEDVLMEEAIDEAVECRIFNSKVAQELKENEEFKRKDMFYIIYRCLKSYMSDGTLFARYLQDSGVLSQSEADAYDDYGDFENIDELIDRILG